MEISDKIREDALNEAKRINEQRNKILREALEEAQRINETHNKTKPKNNINKILIIIIVILLIIIGVLVFNYLK